MSNLALFPSYYGVLVQIIAFDSGCLYLIPHLGGNPEHRLRNSASKN